MNVPINSVDIVDSGTLGRKVLQARSTEELRKLLVLPRNRSVTMERVGWWIGGSTIAVMLGSIVNLIIWSASRTDRQAMEGGWTRTVIDQTIPYLSTTYIIVIGIAVGLWTLVSIAYWLVADNS